MKKKRKTNVRVLSVLLTLCLMLSVVFSAPMTVTAATVGERNDIIVSDAAVSKLESIDGNKEVVRTPIRRLYEEEGDDLNKTVWLNDDGTRTMTIYDYPVKFVNAAGQIQDISLDVAEATDGSGAFKTAAGWTNTVFPSKITDGVTLSGNGEALKLTPVMPQGSLVASAERSNKLVAKDKVSRKDNKTVSYNYDSKTNIEYSLTYNGFKEDIVVNEYTGQTEYSFLLETNGLTLVNNNGSYHLEDAKGNIKASVGDVIIFTADERNNTMGYMTHTTVKENHSYFLTIHVDADWLKDEKTVYPIRIDPTLEMTDTEKLVEDVTIYSGGASNPTSAVLYVGRRPDALGTSRVLLKFPNLDLSDINSAKNVVSAGIRMRDLMCETDPMGVYCYIYDGNNWEDNTATWANNAEGYTHFMSHNDVSYYAGVGKSPKHSYYFSITPAVKYWKLTDAEKAARPDNYDMEKGIMLKAKDDTTMDYQYKSFGSYNRSNYRPTIEIVYNNNTESPAKPFGWFDKVTDTEISGWAWCLDYPSAELVCSALLYDVVTGSRVSVITGRAQNYRWDVKAAGYGTGCYGFNLPVDWSSLPLGDYRILVEVWDVNNQLSYVIPHSPMYYSNNGVRIFPDSLSLSVGDTQQLSVAVFTENTGETGLAWNSTNTNVAVVEAGVVLAVGPGTTDITARDVMGHISNKCTITVQYDFGMSIQNAYPETCEMGGDGNYATFGMYADNLKSQLQQKMNMEFDRRGTDSWSNDFKNKNIFNVPETYTNIDDVHLMIFTGHGYAKDRDKTEGLFRYNSMHFGTMNSPNGHPEGNGTLADANFTTQDAAFFGFENKTQWLLAYTCNFLNTKHEDPYVMRMLDNGGRLVMGMGTKSHINANEGADFGNYLISGYTFKDAFIKAGQDNQEGKYGLGKSAKKYSILYYGPDGAGTLNDTIVGPLEYVEKTEGKLLVKHINKTIFNKFEED